MPKYDKDLIKQAAEGRWPEIVATLSGVDQSILDGEHHPCPKCSGSDRFNFSRKGDGGAYCNQCQPGTGDGFGTIQWLTGWDFAQTIEAVAKHCGVPEVKGKKKADPAEHLEFLNWNPTLVGLWCLKKKPIKPAAIQAIGGRVAKYRGQYTVIAIPVWGPSRQAEPPVGWVLYKIDGGMLPKWTKAGGKTPEWVKVKLTAGSVAGVICHKWCGDATNGVVIWKTEGPTDLLALLSVAPDVEAFTTANGAGEKPLDWIVQACSGKPVNVVHDADKPGQDGATWVPLRDGQRRPGWCPTLATVASEVRNVSLPFPVEPNHGPDLRDFFAGNGSYETLLERAAAGEVFAGESAEAVAEFIDEREEDPHRLARINMAQYESEHGARLVYWRDEWWRYKAGAYAKIGKNDLRSKVNAAIRLEFIQQWRDRQKTREADKPVRPVTPAIVSSTIEAMQSMARISWNIEMQTVIDSRQQANYVAMENGLLDLDAVFAGKPGSECLLPHTNNWFSTIKLSYPFIEDADCPLWLEYLKQTFEGDGERIQLVQEWAGYLLTVGNSEQKFLALEGEGGNGKTVFLAAMTAMIGDQNISVVPLEKFGGRFDLYGTVGKMANICGDVGEIDRVAEGHLKDFTGGGAMSFDRKGIEPIQCIPTAKLMMSWNTRPRFRDRSQGLWRRMLLVPFNRRVPDHEKVPGMADPDWWIRQGEASGILLWAIAGLYRLRRRGTFIEPAASREATEDYQKETNPALEFFADHLECSPDNQLKSDWLYRVYAHWCEKSGVRPLGNRQFGKEVRKKFPQLERKRSSENGRPWIYEGLKFSSEEIFSLETDPETSLF